jgi:DNA-binding MarR family transcriptional regulator/GNAT superfamily N-acetyltransferase
MNPRVGAVRSFNRFYTRMIGLLHEGMLKSAFSLTEVRLMYEISHRDKPTATELARDLSLDAGYLSRILAGFEKRGFLKRTRSESDGRQTHLSLTKAGSKAFQPLDRGADKEVEAMLIKLSDPQQDQLVDSMRRIEQLIGEPKSAIASEPFILRPHRPGDMGWVIHRHGAIYAQEYGWDECFEALVAEIAAKFIREFDPKRERCWIAERDDSIIGSVFLVRQSDEVAKLRLLLVEAQARGLGLGKKLVQECIQFAKLSGYRKITLWTQSNLHAAKHIYQRAGFTKVHEEPYDGIGRDLISETWEITL